MLMLLLIAILLYFVMRKKDLPSNRWTRFFPFMIALPYFANTAGWMLTELGRQPWVVFGLMRTEDAVSIVVKPGMVLTSLIIFTLLYGMLMVADIYLLAKFAKAGPEGLEKRTPPVADEPFYEYSEIGWEG